jgi:hypothetical protein
MQGKSSLISGKMGFGLIVLMRITTLKKPRPLSVPDLDQSLALPRRQSEGFQFHEFAMQN